MQGLYVFDEKDNFSYKQMSTSMKTLNQTLLIFDEKLNNII